MGMVISYINLAVAIITIDQNDNITESCEIVRYIDCDDDIIVLEVKCKRYVSAKLATQWALYPIATAPAGFVNLLNPDSTQSKLYSRDLLHILYGENNMQLPRTSVWQILAKQMVHPFYLFQYFSVAVW